MKNELNIPRIVILAIALIAYSILNVVVVSEVGMNIFEPLTHTWPGRMILADMIIGLSLCTVWLWQDARANGRNPWPWLVLIVLLAFTGPLLYLLLYKSRK